MDKIKIIILINILYIINNNEYNSNINNINKYKKYKKGEKIIIWYRNILNKKSKLESYLHSKLSICNEEEKRIKNNNFLDIIQGNMLEESNINIEYNENLNKNIYCKIKLTNNLVERLKYLIINEYNIELYIDKRIFYILIGKLENDIIYIYTHIKFIFDIYNNNIININIKQFSHMELIENSEMNLTYEVQWTKLNNIPFNISDNELYSYSIKIRYISIINSIIIMVLILSIAIWILINTLKYDIERYNKIKNNKFNIDDEYGWKLVYRDVFRTPKYIELLSCFIGIGIQLFCTILFILLIIIFTNYSESNNIINLIIFIYITFSPVSSFICGCLYKKMNGYNWLKLYILNVSLFPSITIFLTIFISIVARIYTINRYLDINSFLYLIIIFILLLLPLSFIGIICSRSFINNDLFSTNNSDIPGVIPRKKWYMELIPLSLIISIIPFGSICIEIYFILTTFWIINSLLVYKFLLIILLVSVVISISINIISVYLLLNNEDYRWQWFSLLNGMSVGLYVLLFSIVFQIKRYYNVTSFFQLIFYYSYSLLISLSIGLIYASFNFLSANLFIRRLYQNIKPD